MFRQAPGGGEVSLERLTYLGYGFLNLFAKLLATATFGRFFAFGHRFVAPDRRPEEPPKKQTQVLSRQ